MVTNFYGNKCGSFASEPFIIDCNYDLAGKMLQYIYKNMLRNPGQQIYSNVVSIDQNSFIP